MNNKIVTFAIVSAFGAFSTITYNIILEDCSEYMHKPSSRNVCETIHMGIVCERRNFNAINFYITLKVIVFYRSSPLHLHLLVDNYSEMVLKTLFEAWKIPQVTVSIYNYNNLPKKFHWVMDDKNSGHLPKLAIALLTPKSVSTLLILDLNLFCIGDIETLWKFQYQDYSQVQILSNPDWASNAFLIKIQSSEVYSTSLEKVPSEKRDKENFKLEFTQLAITYKNVDSKQILCNPISRVQDINEFTATYNAITKFNLKLLPKLSFCSEYINEDLNISRYHMKECVDITEAKGRQFNYCTFLFVKEFKHKSSKEDVTLVIQITFKDLQDFDSLCSKWPGPVSVVIYLEEKQILPTLQFLKVATHLKKRSNIAFHVVLKEGMFYPINKLRNIALKHVNTPHVFLSSIGMMPGGDLYRKIKNHIKSINNMTNKALVIPAFSLVNDTLRLPTKFNDIKQMIDKNLLIPFQENNSSNSHNPTNYTAFKTATQQYTVQWKPNYEPHVVVEALVAKYDERFIGFTWNKVQHILELNAANYQFIVLPETFLVYKLSTPNNDLQSCEKTPNYNSCMTAVKKLFLQDIKKKYNCSYDLSNF